MLDVTFVLRSWVGLAHGRGLANDKFRVNVS